jgi:hypothetical protein
MPGPGAESPSLVWSCLPAHGAALARLAAALTPRLPAPTPAPLSLHPPRCYCEKDEHCSPEFKCVPSYAMPEFKVCKPPADWDPQLAARGVPTGLARFLIPLGK